MEQMIRRMLDRIYPVGSIYMSVNETSPDKLFGGTWERYGNGKVPVGVDENDADFNVAEKTGGEKTHKLTVTEMPKHRHIIQRYDTGNPRTETGSIDAGTRHDLGNDYWFTNFAGGDQPHNNLQPYITCYMWKRTA